jgi:drug/metabolite transporter (DMT)-like permease
MGRGRTPTMVSRYILIMLISVMVASISQVLLKKSTYKSYNNVIREYLNPYVICGYGLLVVSMLLTVCAYSGMEYKNGPIIEALGNVFVLVLSFFVFGEKISRKKLFGIGIIILGIIVFNI